ncbi:carboxypeptidase-like regulatory domain-containing protein [Hymenobacter crusticola]|nr:carboxypeptidase-like regulatory domain-containing protein [Hymenobacter crusticola]
MNYLRLLPLLTISLVACVSPTILRPGDYQQTGDADQALFSSQQLRLYPDHTFEYFRHEDVIGAGQQGSGVYHVQGKQLQLQFGPPVTSRSATAQSRSLPPVSQGEELNVTFLVTGAIGRGIPEVVPGATILAYNRSGQVVAGTVSDSVGQATLQVNRSQQPHTLRITSGGFHAWEQVWPDQATAYQVHLQANVGTSYGAESRMHFRILQQTAKQLIVKQGRDTTKLRWGPLR